MHGITATLPGFYGPQGRSIQIKSTFKETLQNLYKTQLGEFHITNFEMETSGIYALANLLGHEAHSFSDSNVFRIGQEISPFCNCGKDFSVFLHLMCDTKNFEHCGLILFCFNPLRNDPTFRHQKTI